MTDYVAKLVSCGMRIDDAMVLVKDFERELDFDGLADYVNEYENLAYVGRME